MLIAFQDGERLTPFFLCLKYAPLTPTKNPIQSVNTYPYQSTTTSPFQSAAINPIRLLLRIHSSPLLRTHVEATESSKRHLSHHPNIHSQKTNQSFLRIRLPRKLLLMNLRRNTRYLITSNNRRQIDERVGSWRA